MLLAFNLHVFNRYLLPNLSTKGRCPSLKPLTALSIGTKAAKAKTTLLVSMSDFMIISFRKSLILLVHNCYKVIMSNEEKQI